MLTKSLMLCGVGAAALCAAMWMGQPVGAQDAGKPSGPAASAQSGYPDVPGAKVEKYPLRKLLMEYVAASGKRLHIEEPVLAGLKDSNVIVPSSPEFTTEDRVREGLHTQRLTMLPLGGGLTVLPFSQAVFNCPLVAPDDVPARHKLEFVSCLLPIEGAEVTVVRTSVAPFVSREAVVAPIQGANVLLISDIASNVQRIIDIVKTLKANPDNKKGIAVYNVPEGLDGMEIAQAVLKVLGINGYCAESRGRFIYSVAPRDADHVAKQIAEIAAGLKK